MTTSRKEVKMTNIQGTIGNVLRESMSTLTAYVNNRRTTADELKQYLDEITSECRDHEAFMSKVRRMRDVGSITYLFMGYVMKGEGLGAELKK